MAIKYFDMMPFPVFVGFCDDPVSFEQELKRIGLDDPTPFLPHERAGAATHSFYTDRLNIVVCMDGKNRRRDKTMIAAIIAHEAVHVMQRIKEELSPHDALGIETEAYLVQYVTQSCLIEFWRTGKVITVEP